MVRKTKCPGGKYCDGGEYCNYNAKPEDKVKAKYDDYTNKWILMCNPPIQIEETKNPKKEW